MAKKNALLSKKYEPSEALAEIVGDKLISRPQVTKLIWAYIKKYDLQDSKNRRLIVPDDILGEIIGHKPIDMMKMTKKISEHLFDAK